MTAPAKPTIDEQILQNQLAACQKECKEQARLNGMGSEREAKLMAQLAELQRKHDGLVARLREPVDEYLNISDLWKKSEDDAEGMDLGHPTQAHYFAALLQQAMSAVALPEDFRPFCDPECEGRCKKCPDDIIRDLRARLVRNIEARKKADGEVSRLESSICILSEFDGDEDALPVERMVNAIKRLQRRAESAEAELAKERDARKAAEAQIVWEFDLEHPPIFRQGNQPLHETMEVVTAERCADFVAAIESAEARAREMFERTRERCAKVVVKTAWERGTTVHVSEPLTDAIRALQPEGDGNGQ